MKERISACALVSMQDRLAPESWMSMRRKAIVDMPEARAHHAAAVMGAGLFVHGGHSSADNKTLGDWNLFDFGLQVWIKCNVVKHIGNKPFNHVRKYHTMTAAVDPMFSSGREQTRLVWVIPLDELMRKPKNIEQGFYIFGGIDAEGAQTDDLIWV